MNTSFKQLGKVEFSHQKKNISYKNFSKNYALVIKIKVQRNYTLN